MNMSQCVHPLQLLFAVICSQATRQEGFGSAQIYRPALSMACHSMTCMYLATLATVALHASASEANMTKVNMISQQQLMHGLTTGESTAGLNRSSARADVITGVSRDLINASWSAFMDRGTTTYVEARNVCAP